MVRRGTGVRRVGHAGTLDPLATGVLVVCVGQATRISEYLLDLPKTYRATIELGRTTTTYDAEGETTSTANATGVSREAVEEPLRGFVGEIEQTPPAFSAVKVGGERAYRAARRGEAVALASRPATVYRIDLLRFEPPEVEIEVECGKGTYIRSLAHDLGQALGCGAYLASLVRTRVGPFGIESAADMTALDTALSDGTWRERLLPMDCGLAHLPSVTLGADQEREVRHGKAVPLDCAPDAPLLRGYGEDRSLVAILRWDTTVGAWKPRKVFG